ncbi:MAG: hypothetical protein U0Z17_05720 [Bacteroidales bacterium]
MRKNILRSNQPITRKLLPLNPKITESPKPAYEQTVQPAAQEVTTPVQQAASTLAENLILQNR